MGSLQSLLDEQLSTVPWVIATDLVRNKLKAAGHAEDEKLISSIVEQLLGSGDVAIGDHEDAIEIETGEDIVLQFTNADTARVHDYAEKIRETLPELIHTVADKAADKMLCRYEGDWAEWRDATEIQMDQFRFNLQARWGKGFDALRILIELSRDIGTDFHRRSSRSRSRRRVHLNKALSHLHVRAIQIASEIMVLMENGYADGAIARWRTLHEVACVAMVLGDGGETLAERYLAHEIVEAKKGSGNTSSVVPKLAMPHSRSVRPRRSSATMPMRSIVTARNLAATMAGSLRIWGTPNPILVISRRPPAGR